MNKKKIALIMTAAMAASMMFAGCGKTVDSSVSGSASTAATGETATSESSKTVTVDYSIGLKKNGYYKDVKAKKVVTLPDDYTHIEISREDLNLDDIDVASTISQIAASYGDRVTVDRAAQEGDEVVVDYEGTVDGERFTGSTTSDAQIVLGSGTYIPGFEDQLVGRFAGEVFDITVTFPDEYPTGTDLDGNELELAGKEAVFRTTLKEVDEVTLTDENVKDNIATQDAFVLNDGSAVDTVDKLNQFYNEKYEQDALSTAVFNYVVENSSISEIPQQLLDDQRESYRQEIQAAIASYDMTEDEYFQQVGVDSMDALLDTYADQIKESVSDFLIFQAVAEEQKIKVTDDDVSNYFGGDALSVKQAKAYYGEAYLNQNVLYEKVYTWLVDHASIV